MTMGISQLIIRHPEGPRKSPLDLHSCSPSSHTHTHNLITAWHCSHISVKHQKSEALAGFTMFVCCVQFNLKCAADSGEETPHISLISWAHVWSTRCNTAQLLFLSLLRGWVKTGFSNLIKQGMWIIEARSAVQVCSVLQTLDFQLSKGAFYDLNFPFSVLFLVPKCENFWFLLTLILTYTLIKH